MAYSVNDPLNCLTPASLAVGPRLWFHESADTGAAAQVDGFITNGVARGLKVGDIVWHRNTGTDIISSHRVLASTSAPGVAVDLTDATTVVSGTNSD